MLPELLDILPVVFQQTPVLLELFTPDEVQAELEFTPGIKAGQAAILFIAFQMTDEVVRQIFRVEPGDSGEAHQVGTHTDQRVLPSAVEVFLQKNIMLLSPVSSRESSLANLQRVAAAGKSWRAGE